MEHAGIGAQRALAGGGRYDLLAPAIGASQPVPAVGFAAGMERLILAMEASELSLPEEHPFDVWMVALGETAGREAFLLLQTLRSEGLRVGMELGYRSMKAQMRLANRACARQVVIVADRELEAEVATVKDMNTGEQLTIPLAQLADNLIKTLN